MQKSPDVAKTRRLDAREVPIGEEITTNGENLYLLGRLMSRSKKSSLRQFGQRYVSKIRSRSPIS